MLSLTITQLDFIHFHVFLSATDGLGLQMETRPFGDRPNVSVVEKVAFPIQPENVANGRRVILIPDRSPVLLTDGPGLIIREGSPQVRERITVKEISQSQTLLTVYVEAMDGGSHSRVTVIYPDQTRFQIDVFPPTYPGLTQGVMNVYVQNRDCIIARMLWSLLKWRHPFNSCLY